MEAFWSWIVRSDTDSLGQCDIPQAKGEQRITNVLTACTTLAAHPSFPTELQSAGACLHLDRSILGPDPNQWKRQRGKKKPGD